MEGVFIHDPVITFEKFKRLCTGYFVEILLRIEYHIYNDQYNPKLRDMGSQRREDKFDVPLYNK